MSNNNQSDDGNLTCIPSEICRLVAALLENCDIKNLRLVCRVLRDNFPLRIGRVFLSANPLNVQTFRSIAEHEVYRHGITEIVWDDAQLVAGLGQEEGEEMQQDQGYPSDEENGHSAPRWFSLACRKNLGDERSRKGVEERPAWRARMQQLEAQLPVHESWAIYQDLLRQQQQVLADGSDIAALRYGLSRFPALRTITVTPAAHGYLFAPLYKTPMIRSFPYGFNYPIPHGWPMPRPEDLPYELRPWSVKAEREQWRGVSIILRELAQQPYHRVNELLFNVHNVSTGVSSRILEQPCEEYENLAALLARPGFRSLDLSLLADGDEDGAWGTLRNGRLHKALAKATDLEYLHFRTETDFDQFDMPDQDFPRLRSLLPLEHWPKLQHLRLTKVLVDHDELLDVLISLPTSICTIELSHLRFMEEGGDRGYQELMRGLREDLDWRNLAPSQRPRLVVHADANGSRHFRYQDLDAEVNDFAYGQGDNPPGDMYASPSAGAIRSAFEPELEVFTLHY
ncbi:hypothetical protein PFICI_02970 [Pestalotiopsis fici W106-1]|uniref:F-box domain-containing protein n=1 Tax=Pestalotiopsis fici (strain W106-1 / CGMCC3.15140) TaxID=1229662 RepID=W3XFY4_PESFW|nr:uncharacterized protein PFICI_02970 [Pestalotiopsis fici W106-1]ETS84945.1 hypothetical protein PFICI_02970 [Pestalotiopsis fici W106-1]